MRIAVTGANGFFAWEFIRRLASEKDVEIIAIPFNVVLTKADMPYDNIRFLNSDEVIADPELLRGIDVLVHTAFCRKSIGSQLISSLKYLNSIACAAAKGGVKGFINLSSQSVYGGDKVDLPDETGVVNPNYLYSLAKTCSEVLLESVIKCSESEMSFTNVRLASLMGVSNDVPRNVLYKFICSALAGEDLNIVGGEQKFSFIDVGDAAEAVKRLCFISPDKWESAYNVGPEKQIGMLEMAKLVCKTVNKIQGNTVSFNVKNDDIQLNAGMNSALLYKTLNWKPEISFEQTVESTINYVKNMNL